MSYAAIIVYVSADRVSCQLVSVAAALADKFSAKLIGLSALAIMPPFAAEGAVAVDNATEYDIVQMKAKLADAGNKFRAAAGSDRQTEWRSALEFPTETLLGEARSADLVVIGQNRPPGNLYRVVDNGAAIMGMGRPVLVVPETVASLRADYSMVGWKDSREARRAVLDALPFLRNAYHVTVAEICEDEQRPAARDRVDDVRRYLTRHGVKADFRVETQRGSDADRLIKLAEEEGADLLVTGAYGHSRLNEWIFGGVTRDLLTSSPISCLMSH